MPRNRLHLHRLRPPSEKWWAWPPTTLHFSRGVNSEAAAGQRLFRTAAVGGKVTSVWHFLLPRKSFSTLTSPLMCWVNTLSVISFKHESHRSFRSRRRTERKKITRLWLLHLRMGFPNYCVKLMKTFKGRSGNHANVSRLGASIWAQSSLPSEYSSKVANVL